MKFVEKPKKVMGEYIALHGLVPANELPHKLRGKIPKNEVWVRSDKWDTPEKRAKLRAHEGPEIALMKKGVKYKKAHEAAQKFERNRFK